MILLQRILNVFTLAYSHLVMLFALLLFTPGIYANDVDTNTSDDRVFETLTLENGLRVLLIFDPTADKAAAALDIQVGSSLDPDTHFGLAHFVEHMLFMGTEKYPTAGDFQQYLGQYGGEHNAYTSLTHTNYHFALDPSALDGALDRFSQFFIAPNFDHENVTKEVDTIQAEYKAGYFSEERRSRDVIRSVVATNHPLTKFATGNRNTLQSDADSFALRGRLIEFFQQYYRAERMTLVVSSPYSISDLKQYVVPKFSKIQSNGSSEQWGRRDFLTKSTRGAMVEIQAEQDVKRLSLIFPVPDSRPHYKEKPLEYIAQILASRGEGSLYDLFVSLGWATALNTSIEYTWPGGDAYAVNVSLTETGLAQTNLIRFLILDYLQFLNEEGVEKSRFENLAKIGDMHFRFYEKNDVMQAVSEFAANMHYTPVKSLISSNYQFSNFDGKLVRDYLSRMTYDNSLTVVVHPFVKLMEGVQQSDYYHTSYVLHPESTVSSQLGNVQLKQLKQYRKKLRLPKSNIYLSDDVELVEFDDVVWKNPEVLRSKYGVTTWYMPDQQYRLPKTFIKAQWTLPAATRSAEISVALEMMTLMLEREFSASLYEAESAGLNFNFEFSAKGIELEYDSFSTSVSPITRYVSGMIGDAMSSRRLRQRLVKKHFTNVYRELSQRERNKTADDTFVQAYRELSATLYNPRWTAQDITHALAQMSEERFLTVSKKMFEGAKANVFIYGNETERSAGRLARYFEKVQRKNKSRPAISPSLVIDISEEPYLYVKDLPVNNDDSALMLYVQGHNDDLKERAKFLLLDEMIRAPFYNTLRTEKQLGYLVQSEQFTLKNVPGLICVVQSPNSSPLEIYQTMNQFFFNNISSVFDDFYQHRKAVLAKLDAQPQNQRDTAYSFWLSIQEGDLEFNERQKLREIIADMSIYRMKKFYYSRVLNKTGRVLFVGNKGGLNIEGFEKNALLITDAFTFKNSMPVYLYP